MSAGKCLSQYKEARSMFDTRSLVLSALLLSVGGCAPVEEPEGGEDAGAVETLGPPTPAPRASETAGSGVRNRVEAALKQVRQRDLLTTNSFWTIFHGILGVGPDAMLVDPLTGRKVNAI